MENKLKMKSLPSCDPDYRNRPKTSHYCQICQKDIKEGSKFRMIHLVNGGGYILHPSSEHDYISDGGDLMMHPIGMSCAKKIGLEWSV